MHYHSNAIWSFKMWFRRFSAIRLLTWQRTGFTAIQFFLFPSLMKRLILTPLSSHSNGRYTCVELLLFISRAFNSLSKILFKKVWLGLCVSMACVTVFLNLMQSYKLHHPSNWHNRIQSEKKSEQSGNNYLLSIKEHRINEYLYVFGNLLSQGLI